MKRFIDFKSPALVLLFALCVLPPFPNGSFAQGDKSKRNKLQMVTASLRADSQLVKPGEEIPIHLLVKPKLDAAELVKHTGFGPKEWLGCSVRVVDKKGNEVPLTRRGEHTKKAFEFWGPVEGSVHIESFHLAKDSSKSEIVLNRYFDMTLDGEYLVTVTRWVTFRYKGKLVVRHIKFKPLKIKVEVDADIIKQRRKKDRINEKRIKAMLKKLNSKNRRKDSSSSADKSHKGRDEKNVKKNGKSDRKK